MTSRADLHALFRRPIALVATDGRLFVANQRSGTLSIVDPARAQVVSEIKVAEQLSDLAPLGNGYLLASDDSAGQLLLLDRFGDSITVSSSIHVGYSPVSIRPAPYGSWCAVALLWAHQLAIVDLRRSDDPKAHAAGMGPALSLRKTIDLPFAPLKQCVLPDGKTLVVADAFGQNLALIDVPSGSIRSLRSVEGHNIRGLSMSSDGRQLLLSHPILSQKLPTTHDNIFWGSVMGNAVRAIDVPNVLNLPPASEIRDPSNPVVPIGHWSHYALGEQGNATGDPNALAVARDGRVMVALAGVDEVAIGSLRDGLFQPVPVGRRPTALALDPNNQTLYVANTLDDSISVIDISSPTPHRAATISLGSQPPLTAADRGERLFYDSRLARDGWYSCNTCHTDGHTCGLLNDNFSDGTYGTPKRIPPLGGVADTAPYAWNGSIAMIEEQIRHSILRTMDGKPERASEQNVADLAAFLRTLPPAPSLALARGRIDDEAVARGYRAFQQWDCDHCHEPPTFTSPRAYDVRHPDELGQRKWNPPSLRGVSQLPALFHDNSASSLRDVLYRFKHPHGQDLSGQIDDLVTFLESL
ncbi:MAG TPA: cytochrome c peroxidase [Tepidisphaeraceae bacterium]